MSDIPSDYQERLNIREQISRIDRARAESEKLAVETPKFVSEQHKLDAEARKLNRDRWFTPALVVGGLSGGVVTCIGFGGRALHWWP